MKSIVILLLFIFSATIKSFSQGQPQIYLQPQYLEDENEKTFVEAFTAL